MTGINVQRMSFRPGKSMLIPYIPFALKAAKDVYLESITVGPTPHSELAEQSVRSLLAHWNAGKIKVHSSALTVSRVVAT